MVGLGYGDVTTRRCLNRCDSSSISERTYIDNIYTIRVPMVLETDRCNWCMSKYCGNNDKQNPRVMRIPDNAYGRDMGFEALLNEVRKNYMEIIGGLEEIPFDTDGNLW